MARRGSSNGDPNPVDRTHPRLTFDLVGQGEALTRAARAIRTGRPPQAWLICGPPGLGKATFAYRIARYLLAYGATGDGPADLAVPPDAPVSAQIAAGAHPGLLVLARGVNPDTGRAMTVLPVGEIRKLTGFFGLTSGAGGWRVAIIDTADEMNDAAANALLKMLEEPPAHSMLLLLANAPGRLLPTIRSRCQRLQLRPLPAADLDQALESRMPQLSGDQRAALVRLAGGSLGLALRLAGSDGLALARDADEVIEQARHPDFAALMALADRVARMADGLGNFGDVLVLTLGQRIRDRARDGDANLKPWIDARERLTGLFARAGALHLEPRQTILSAAHVLARTDHAHR